MSKKVIVTGAASGMGRSLIDLALQRGDQVFALDVDREKLEALPPKKSLKTYLCDVSSSKRVREVAQEIKGAFGIPDIWVNSAGIAINKPFQQLSDRDFDRVLKVNFNGLVYGTRAALDLMKGPNRGTVVNISSVAGLIPAPFMTAYVASKYAVAGFTRALREELAQEHSSVQVTLVFPGFVKTPMTDAYLGDLLPSWADRLRETPEKVAREIWDGVNRGKAEIYPTLHGKALIKLARMAPEAMVKSSRIFTARNWKELVGISPIYKK